MQRHTQFGCAHWIHLALFALLANVQVGAIAQSKDPASTAPPETIFFAGITDYEKFVESYKHTTDYLMMNDPAVKVLESSDKKTNLSKVRERLATVLGLTPDDLQPPFKGTVSFYITAPRGGTWKQVDGAFVAGIGDATRARKIYDALAKKCKERSDSYESVSVGSNSIDVYTKDSKPDDDSEDESFDEESEEMENWLFYSPEQNFAELINDFIDKVIEGKHFPEKFAMCLTSDRFIAGPTPDAVKAALRQSQSDESLADSEDYKTFLRKYPDAGPLRVVVSIPRMVELSASEDEDGKKFVASLGLEGMRSFVMGIDIGKPEYDSKGEGLLLMSGERTGIPKLLTMDNRPIAPPSTLASRPIFAMSLNLSVIKMFDEIERMTRKVSPENADIMRQQLENSPGPDGEPINIRKDILENLREPLTFSFSFSRPYTPESARILLGIGHRNAETIQKLFARMIPSTARDVHEAQVFDVPMFGASIGVSTDHIFSGNTSAVESAVQTGEREGLATDANFKRAAKFLPEEAWGMFYFDVGQLLDAVIGFGEKRDELKEMATMNAGAMIAQGFAAMYTSQFKSSKPDEVRALLKHYGFGVVTFSTTPDGLHITQLVMRPTTE